MNIQEKIQEKEQQFKAVSEKRDFLVKNVKEQEEELLKIMGEYRLLEELQKEELQKSVSAQPAPVETK